MTLNGALAGMVIIIIIIIIIVFIIIFIIPKFSFEDQTPKSFPAKPS